MLVAEYGDMSKPFIVLTGHMDTVFADGTAAKRPFTVENGKVTGPGCLDMKGGVTILLYAVKFLTSAGYDRYPLKIILAGENFEKMKSQYSGLVEENKRKDEVKIDGDIYNL